MDTVKFLATFNESRNGCNARIRHPVARKLVYSDGVQQCAEIGCYWLLDVVGTEVLPTFFKHRDHFAGLGFVKIEVTASRAARIWLEKDEGVKPVWSRDIAFTDLPTGKFTFYLADEGNGAFLFLATEY